MESTTIQTYFEDLIQKDEKPDSEYKISRTDFGELVAIADVIKDAWDFYYVNVEQADWGSARLYKLVIDDMTVYVVWVSTDGDDGWLEIYDIQGNSYGMGKIYVDKIAWRGLDIREEV